MSGFRTLTYHSREAKPMDTASLAKLLLRAQRFNEQAEITGLLAYANGRFLQTIEGEDDAIASVFARITNDPQHTDIVPFIDEAIERRCYPTWAMISTIDRGNQMILGLLAQKLSNPSAQFTSAQTSAIRRTLDFVEAEGNPDWIIGESPR
jgi:hypothetical protein